MWEIHDCDSLCPSSVAGWIDFDGSAIGFAIEMESDIAWVSSYFPFEGRWHHGDEADSWFDDIPITAMVQGF